MSQGGLKKYKNASRNKPHKLEIAISALNKQRNSIEVDFEQQPKFSSSSSLKFHA